MKYILEYQSIKKKGTRKEKKRKEKLIKNKVAPAFIPFFAPLALC